MPRWPNACNSPVLAALQIIGGVRLSRLAGRSVHASIGVRPPTRLAVFIMRLRTGDVASGGVQRTNAVAHGQGAERVSEMMPEVMEAYTARRYVAERIIHCAKHETREIDGLVAAG